MDAGKRLQMAMPLGAPKPCKRILDAAATGIDDMRSDIDDADLRRAFACFPTGVTAVCAVVEGQPVGMAASSFTSVSIEPPLVSVCMRKSSNTWRKLAPVPRLGLSFLGVEHEIASRQLAAQTGDRFAGVAWQPSASGAVFITGASVRLECSIHRRIAAGDHEIVLLQIETLSIQPGVKPLVFHASRYHQLAAP
jgi:flavin reductase (DIM6/NTAB) family NADH-FMN oxidoreductase RutF